MRFAIPVTGEELDQHFGHCEALAFVDVVDDTKEIASIEIASAPKSDHSRLPALIKERGATHVIAGGMGMGMYTALEALGVELIEGAPSGKPAEIVRQYLDGALQLAE